jgi:chromatin remodeling complex protein RSC6
MIHFCIFNIVIFIQVVKQLRAYTGQNNLQDPDYKRKIICNDELHVVFGTDAVGMFKMNKLLANLLLTQSTCSCFLLSALA